MYRNAMQYNVMKEKERGNILGRVAASCEFQVSGRIEAPEADGGDLLPASEGSLACVQSATNLIVVGIARASPHRARARARSLILSFSV